MIAGNSLPEVVVEVALVSPCGLPLGTIHGDSPRGTTPDSFPTRATLRLGPLAFGLALLASLAAGCSSSLDSPRYPDHLTYPNRQDYLFKGELKTPPTSLPSPGQLDESIKRAVERKENDGVGLNPADVSRDDQTEIRAALEEIFGTPARPRIEPVDPAAVSEQRQKSLPKNAADSRKLFTERLSANLAALQVSADAIDGLNIDEGVLRKGSELYRKHCLHCHGLAGDGRGPTGSWVHPHPRDYRGGLFKFISTSAEVPNRKPRRADLHRTLAKGIDGTSMPAFGLPAAGLPEAEMDALVSYVIHLSIRGQTEHDVLRTLITKKGDKSTLEGGNVRTEVYSVATQIYIQWGDSNKQAPIKPGEYTIDDNDKEAVAASVRNGYALFLDKGGCMACHTDYGRQVPYRYDVWGTLVQPRNLTAGNYRGGRRPIDLYWRISGGIEPSGMSAGKTLSEKERWDLVNFVQRLPFPAMLPQDIRDKVYKTSAPAKPSDAHASR